MARTRTPDAVLAALGFSAEQDRVYRRALSLSGSDLVTIAGACQLTPDEVLVTLAEPMRLGLVRHEDQRLHVLDPAPGRDRRPGRSRASGPSTGRSTRAASRCRC